MEAHRFVGWRSLPDRPRPHQSPAASLRRALVGVLCLAVVGGCSIAPSPTPSTSAPTVARTHWVVPEVNAATGRLGVPTDVMDGARFTVLGVARIPDEARVAHPNGAIAASITVCTVAATDVVQEKWFVYTARGEEFTRPAGEGKVDATDPNGTYAGDMRPYFPSALGVQAGVCKTGWLPFDVPDGERAALLRYKGVGVAVDWVIDVP